MEKKKYNFFLKLIENKFSNSFDDFKKRKFNSKNFFFKSSKISIK